MVVIFMEVLLGRPDFYTIPYILYFQKVPWQFRLAYLAKISGGKEVQRRLINTFGCSSLALWKTIYANLLTILKKKKRIKCESCHRPKKKTSVCERGIVKQKNHQMPSNDFWKEQKSRFVIWMPIEPFLFK